MKINSEEFLACKAKLKDEYARCYDKVEAFISFGRRFDNEDKDDCLQQVLDDFLSAQEEERPIANVVGDDLKKYCKNMITAETGRMNFIFYWLGNIAIGVFMIMVINILVNIVKSLNANSGFADILRSSKILIGFAVIVLITMIHTIIHSLIMTIFNNKFIEKPKAIKWFYKSSYIIIYIVIVVMFSDFDIWVDTRELKLSPILYIFVMIISLIIAIIYTKARTKMKKVYELESEKSDNQINELEQIICPYCGKKHDYDYLKCPYCKKYNSKMQLNEEVTGVENNKND